MLNKSSCCTRARSRRKALTLSFWRREVDTSLCGRSKRELSKQPDLHKSPHNGPERCSRMHALHPSRAVMIDPPRAQIACPRPRFFSQSPQRRLPPNNTTPMASTPSMALTTLTLDLEGPPTPSHIYVFFVQTGRNSPNQLFCLQIHLPIIDRSIARHQARPLFTVALVALAE